MKVLSKYNIFFEHHGRYFVYNTLSSAIVELSYEFYVGMQNNDFSYCSGDDIEVFCGEGVLVDENLDEAGCYLHHYDNYRLYSRRTTLNITLVPTYNCNLACEYCNQGEKKTLTKNLTVKDVQRVSEFIKSYYRDHPEINRININFYGGEPLLCFEFCKTIAADIHGFCAQYDVEFTSLITTNAVLVTQTTVDEFLKPFNVSVQLTIDGLFEVHDCMRKDRVGKGTFSKTLDVIDMLFKNGLKDNITIRSHISDANIDAAEDVISYFKDKTNDFYFAFLKYYKGINDKFKDGCASSRCELVHNFTIQSLLKKYNFSDEPTFGKKMPCSLNTVNTFFIDCNFDVYNCTLMLQNPNGVIGVIDSAGNFVPKPTFYTLMRRTPDRFQNCLKCKLLPTCASGCAANAYFENGTLQSSLCEVSEERLVCYLKDYISLL